MNNSLGYSTEPVNEPAHDRRKSKRFFLHFSIEITGFDQNGRPFVDRTRTENISESGCNLITSVPLQCGDLLNIKLIPPAGETLPEEDAHPFEVVQSSKEGAGWRTGVRQLRQEKVWKVSFPPRNPASEPQSN